MTKMFLLGLLLVNPSLFADVDILGADIMGEAIDWGFLDRGSKNRGFIEITNDSPSLIIRTRCFNRSGVGEGPWKMATSKTFRSCRGAYMRVDIEGGTQRLYFKRSEHCPTKRLYVTISGTAESVETSTSCR